MNIKEQLKKLPELPGVYLMKDKDEVVIYVGKSKNLKHRVSSYFRGFNSHTRKTQTLVTNIHEFEYFITETETDALILESNFIKKYKPKFNVLLKDDKMYPYIRVTLSEKYPRVFMTRQFVKGKDKFFGPYMSAYQVKQTLEVIHSIFPIRKCNRNLSQKSARPCLNYHIRQCAGPCQRYISHEEYMAYINQVLDFLNGNKKWLMDEIENKMKAASKAMDFEKAATYRDQLMAIKGLSEKQNVMFDSEKNQDVISYWTLEDKTCIMMFQIREGKIIGREHYNLINSEEQTASDILSAFLSQYYSHQREMPPEIIISDKIDDLEAYEEWFKHIVGRKIKITVPQKGDKKKIVELVRRNAQEYLMKFNNKIENERLYLMKAKNELSDLLDINFSDLFRVEAYDISNTSGVYSVGSMIVYEKGKKKKSEYRKYKIKTIEGPNDYGSMKEVLYRRLKRMIDEEKIAMNNGQVYHRPDALLIDGGIGHVNAVNEVLEELKIFIPVVGMVKNEYHKTNHLYFDEETYYLKDKKNAFRFISSIQEEVHRYTIEFHKSLRSKAMTHSILEEIPNIGPKRRIALLKKYENIDKIKTASIEDLMETDTIDERTARSIYNFFNPK